MSSDSEFIQEGTRQDLVNAKVRMDHAVITFTQSQSVGEDQRLLASEELHAAVLGLWWRMLPNLKDRNEWTDAESAEFIDGNQIWSGTHPRTGREVEIASLEDLGAWIDRSDKIERPAPGPNHASSTRSHEVKVRLPAGAALAAAEVLGDLYKQLGWGLNSNEQFHDSL